MDFAVEATGEFLRVRFAGNLDYNRHAEICRALKLAESSERPVLLYFDDTVHYVDTISLGEVLLCKQRLLRQDRALAVLVANDHVYDILVLAGIAHSLNASLSEEQALRALRRAPHPFPSGARP
jgi:anti-anti-sigma regulatory factor